MKTNRLQIAEYNIETGENLIRDMTEEETLQHEKDSREQKLEADAFNEKIAAKASAISKLEVLGLTAEEAQSLLN